MRAIAHPTRLRIMSLLTGAPMTAADVARELDINHANASYHLRQLHAAGLIEFAGEERINGGLARRYRYVVGAENRRRPSPPHSLASRLVVHKALAAELVRRSAGLRSSQRTYHMTDAELWVEPAVWEEVRVRITEASRALHEAAKAPRTPGTIRVSASIAMFEMEPDG
jgi:DNA-binding transcriptional ArsR family regulator